MNAIYSVIGKFLGWLDGVTGSYILALFIFAVLVELLMLPFGIKQQRNSIKQSRLRPKEMAIRKKYAGRNDKATQQRVSQEIQELYQKEGFNPMSGCLPLIIQLPIIIILYNIVINPLQYVVGMSADYISVITEFVKSQGIAEIASNSRGTIDVINAITKNVTPESFATVFEGLKTFTTEAAAVNGEEVYNALNDAFSKGLPNFNFLGINLGDTPSFKGNYALLSIPVLTFLTYFGSMKLTRKFTYQPQTAANDAQQGCSNNIMDVSMPLMSVYITFIVPGAIGVYWIFKSLLTTLKQFILYKAMPLPKFTEEDYKAAEKEMKKRAKGAPEAYVNTTGIKPRSLHYIDDEDEAPTAEKGKSAPTAYDRAEADEVKGMASLIESAPIKDDENNSQDENN